MNHSLHTKEPEQLPTNEEIAAYVEGIADPVTQRRVLRAALLSGSVRDRIALLSASDAPAAAAAVASAPTNALKETKSITSRSPDADNASTFASAVADHPDMNDNESEAEQRLQARMLAATHAFVEELVAQQALNAALARGGGGMRGIAAQAFEQLLSTITRLARPLVTGEHYLRLPALAPAGAMAATDSLDTPRETLTTPEGVRIEFQELPGGPPPRLRLIVDASRLIDRQTQEAAATQQDQQHHLKEAAATAAAPPPLLALNTAFVHLEEEAVGIAASPSRHILVVRLNTAGRGLTDFTMGTASAAADLGDEEGPQAPTDDPRVLPLPVAPCRLTGAILAHLPVEESSVVR